jgi:dGTPase
MQSEKYLFSELSAELCLTPKPNRKSAWYRHPLAFLVEAADDICYHVMDIEDGFKAGCIAFDEIVNLHQPWITYEQRVRAEQIKDKNRRVEYFRAATIESMIHDIFGSFTNNYDDIMEAQFDRELSAYIVRAEEFRSFKKLANAKVYKERRVAEIEACGFEVIGGLLNSFTGAIDIKAKTLPHGQNKSRTLLSLMPVGHFE